jgi:hypothetical protein
MNTLWQQRLNADPLSWLLTSQPWIRYRTLTDLMGKSADDPEVQDTKQALLNHPNVQALIEQTAEWFPTSITRHNVPTLSHYKLRMLTDFGLTKDDPGLADIIDKATAHTENQMPAARQTLPEQGKERKKRDPQADEWHAMPCDAPILLYSLLRVGVNTPQVQQSIETLAKRWHTPQGWFCDFFFVRGMFKKLQIGCPMAGLMALEVFSQVPELKESEAARNAYAPLKYHRDSGKSLYYFGRSKKFWTFKYPFVWYNALYLADVLARFDFLKEEELVRKLVNWIEQSQDDQGRFTPTSMFMPYKGWDFANKKEPSPWITFLCCRTLKQWYG